MRAECLPITAVPHTTRLFADYLTRFDRVRSFYPRSPWTHDWVGEQASTIVYDASRRRQIADILESQNRAWGAPPATLKSIERLRAGAAAVVTGQQVTLFGGPLFSLYKALTAVKVAETASLSGVDCVPIFWLATEDHDLDEVSSATLLSGDGQLAKLAIASHAGDGTPVSNATLGYDVRSLLAQARSLLGDSDILEQLTRSYEPGQSFGGAFARLYSHLFADFGVALIDGADPRLHQVASSVYRAAVVGARDIYDSQRERDRALEASGYHQQVKVTPSSTLLFWLRDGVRTPVHRSNRHFVVGGEKLSEVELSQRVATEPENFSGNVLLRPVVQDFLLPTVAYVGGPAEVAYFAQAAVAYEQLLGRVTPVLPRLTATIVEPRVQSLLEKYGLTVADVIHHDAALPEILAQRTLPADVTQGFAAAVANLEGTLKEIRGSLQKLDPTLVPAADKAQSKMRYQLDRLRARAGRAQLRRSGEVTRHAARLVNSLHPHHNLQEREIAGVTLLARHGVGLLRQIYQQTNPSCIDHQVFYL